MTIGFRSMLRIMAMLVFLGGSSIAQATIPAAERAVLTNLYASTNGASWTNKTNWNGAVGTECTWNGIACDGVQSHVTGIYLVNNNLVGTLPSLSGLTALQTFYAWNNQLTGSIPSLSGLTALQHFAVYSNQLTGSIPSLSGLTALQDFWVYSNHLTGSIPSLSGLTALQLFYVNVNQLTGSIPSLSGLTTLRVVDVSYNLLSGSIPSLSGLTALSQVIVNNNQLTGAVPAAPTSLVAGQSNLCSNSLVSSGNPAIDAAWVTAAGNWLACQISTAPPTCTLTASPTSISAGASSRLTVSCNPAATTYSWSANTDFGSAAATGTVSPTVTTTYTVTGSNSSGVSNTASVTVTVITSARPVCTLTASPATIPSGGGTSILTARCTPAASSYDWTGGSCLGNSQPTCIVTISSTTTYTVAGNSGTGPGPTASTTVAVATPPVQQTVSGGITNGVANVRAQVQISPQGTAVNVYVFALAPAAIVSGAHAAKDGSGACVLAQLDSSGHLILASASSLQPAISGVLTAQSQSVTLLNQVPVPQVAGATFFVGVGSDASTMLSTGGSQAAFVIPGSVQCPTSVAAAPGPLSGLWWNSAESGWGISFTQRRNIVFAAWYTYDAAGNPKWYVASNCTLPTGVAGASGICQGPLYEANGPAFFGNPAFNPTAVHVTAVGTLRIDFRDANAASMNYTLNGQTRTVAITRQPLQPGGPAPAIDYTDLWWNLPAGSESGWGTAITQQSGVIFLAWYVYDSGGRPVWYVASNCAVSGNGCSGALYRTTGPAFGPTFDPSRVNAFNVGTVSLDFTDANNGTLTYTIDGVLSIKAITRQLF